MALPQVTDALPEADLVHWIWHRKYCRTQASGAVDRSVDDSFRRVAEALAGSGDGGAARAEAYFALMRSRHFIPGGRIIAGAGTTGDACLVNCFVMPPVASGTAGLAAAIADAAAALRAGGGIGFDLSAVGCGAADGSPGVVDALAQLDAMSSSLAADDRRRGAMMATLPTDHPEIKAFVRAKLRAGALPNFNLSVQVGDAFMQAARGARDSPARRLWRLIAACAHASAEPGVLFVDRINALNTLWYREHLTTTNPCGEAPLPANGACVLGSLCLPRFVAAPFTPAARLDLPALDAAAATAVSLLDAAIDASVFPLPGQRDTAVATRRIGLGVMGLADALLMLGLRYDSAAARRAAGMAMRRICHSAYAASIALAQARGAFPAFDRDRYLAGRFVAALPARLRDRIARHGVRNSHLTAIAPTGSISLLAGGVSSGIEPIFAPVYTKLLGGPRAPAGHIVIANRAVQLWRSMTGNAGLPPAYVAAAEAPARAQIDMQAALQRHVDGAISKTVLLPADASVDDTTAAFDHAYRAGVKGCTVYRPGSVRGAALDEFPRCPERECEPPDGRASPGA
jgi:ribonucleoside-diphosphate reductase alpha chain